jgi:hypothetical protein
MNDPTAPEPASGKLRRLHCDRVSDPRSGTAGEGGYRGLPHEIALQNVPVTVPVQLDAGELRRKGTSLPELDRPASLSDQAPAKEGRRERFLMDPTDLASAVSRTLHCSRLVQRTGRWACDLQHAMSSFASKPLSSRSKSTSLGESSWCVDKESCG